MLGRIVAGALLAVALVTLAAGCGDGDDEAEQPSYLLTQDGRTECVLEPELARCGSEGASWATTRNVPACEEPDLPAVEVRSDAEEPRLTCWEGVPADEEALRLPLGEDQLSGQGGCVGVDAATISCAMFTERDGITFREGFTASPERLKLAPDQLVGFPAP